MKRGLAKLDYTLAIGRADLFPEQIFTVSDFKADIDGQRCLITKNNPQRQRFRWLRHFA